MKEREVVVRVLRGEAPRSQAERDAGGPKAYADLEKRYLESKLFDRILQSGAGRGGAPRWRGNVRIIRDRYGVPHIFGETEADLMFGAGLAQAQDRLWQMDFRRRQANGTLAAILGPNSLKSDITNRTLGHARSARLEIDALSDESHELLDAYAHGVNQWIELAGDDLPVEFDVLGYRPSEWTPLDTMSILRWFWASLTLRLEQIVGAERVLRSATPEVAQWMFTPDGNEYIVPASSGAPAPDGNGGGDGLPGSNNWVAGPTRVTTSKPVLCSDPHWPLFFPSMWYEQHLAGAGIDCIGAAYPGAPPVVFGRTQGAAWGRTNNVASTRDLYHEEIDTGNPQRYRAGRAWKSFESTRERIEVKGAEAHELTLRRTVRGPVVNEIIAPVSEDGDGPITLRWVGHEVIGDFDRMLALNRANDAGEIRTVLEGWRMSIWNSVYADSAGNYGYQMSGSIPRRKRTTRGTRSGTNPDDAWRGYIGTKKLPGLHNPQRGWVASANNTPAPPEMMPGMYGTYADGYRMRRISQLLSGRRKLRPEEVRDIQSDCLDARAHLLKESVAQILEASDDPGLRRLGEALRTWDATYATGSPGAAVWATFWPRFVKRIGTAVLSTHAAQLQGVMPAHLASTLLSGQATTAYKGQLEADVMAVAGEALAYLNRVLGERPERWGWDAAHSALYEHPVAITPELRRIFNLGPFPCPGGGGTVNNRAPRETPIGFTNASGVSYRLFVDLSQDGVAWAATLAGQSAQPGSKHYADRVLETTIGQYHPLLMDPAQIKAASEHELRISGGA